MARSNAHMVEALREPPHAHEAEQAVLGGLMLAPDALANIADWLREGDFYSQQHRLIFRAITALNERGDPCDAVTMGDWFQDNGLAEMVGGASYLIELANSTPSAANIVAYAEIVAEKAKLRAAIDVGTQLTEEAWKRGAAADTVLGLASDRLAQLQQSTVRGGLIPTRQALQAYNRDMFERYQRGPGLIGLSTPWRDLDSRLMGLQPATFYVVGARPSMGKSIFGFQLATHNARKGEHTAVFSVEMAAQKCMARAIACEGQIPFRWVQHPNDEHEEYWPRLTNAIATLNDASWVIDDTPALTVEQFLARARRAHKQKPLKLIVLDHMHDMHLDPKREPRHELGRIAQAGKTLAKEMNIPVVMLAQLNRAAADRKDKRPQMQDLRESGEIEQKADVILFLHREDYYNRDSHLRGLVEVIPAKGRDLDISETVYLANRYDQMRLEDYDDVVPQAPDAAAGGWGKPNSNRTTQ